MQKIIVNLCTVLVYLLSAALVSATENPANILFDQGHGQRFVIADTGDLHLSKLSQILVCAETQVQQTTALLTEDTLNGVNALVISGPFKPFRPEEIEAVLRFVRNGGRLAVMLHIAHPLGDLLTRLGVDFSNSILHERLNAIDKDINFRVTDLSAVPLFEGISSFSAYGAWALKPGESAAGIARTSPTSWVDLNGDGILSRGDAVGALSIVVTGTLGRGDFVIFGDDAIFQNRFLDDDNRKLAANLEKWLTRR